MEIHKLSHFLSELIVSNLEEDNASNPEEEQYMNTI
jgi:hypothetical protein